MCAEFFRSLPKIQFLRGSATRHHRNYACTSRLPDRGIEPEVLQALFKLRQTIQGQRDELDQILQSVARAAGLVSICFDCTKLPTSAVVLTAPAQHNSTRARC